MATSVGSAPAPGQAGYRHAHLWMTITVGILVLAALVVGSIMLQAMQTVNQQNNERSDRAATDDEADATTSPTASPSASPTAVTISDDASAQAVTSELEQIDIDAIQADLEELQASLSAFSSLTE